VRSRFILSTSAGEVSAVSKQLLTNHLQISGWQIWHWQEDLWLLSTETFGSMTAEKLNDSLGEAIPALKNNFVIFKVEGRCTYNGYQRKESWDWMKKFWGVPAG
jgi:hypothetical protein